MARRYVMEVIVVVKRVGGQVSDAFVFLPRPDRMAGGFRCPGAVNLSLAIRHLAIARTTNIVIGHIDKLTDLHSVGGYIQSWDWYRGYRLLAKASLALGGYGRCRDRFKQVWFVSIRSHRYIDEFCRPSR